MSVLDITKCIIVIVEVKPTHVVTLGILPVSKIIVFISIP